MWHFGNVEVKAFVYSSLCLPVDHVLRSLYTVSINEIPAPDAVFIEISYKIFHNRLVVISMGYHTGF